MLVKCKYCGEKIDRNRAFKVTVNDKNSYYCSEAEYVELHEYQRLRDSAYCKINYIFGRKVTNTILFKEIGELASVYTYKKIISYLNSNESYLIGVMNKGFNSEYAQIRYFTAILKNSLSDYQESNVVYNKDIVVDIPKDNYKPRAKRKALIEYETKAGE